MSLVVNLSSKSRLRLRILLLSLLTLLVACSSVAVVPPITFLLSSGSVQHAGNDPQVAVIQQGSSSSPRATTGNMENNPHVIKSSILSNIQQEQPRNTVPSFSLGTTDETTNETTSTPFKNQFTLFREDDIAFLSVNGSNYLLDLDATNNITTLHQWNENFGLNQEIELGNFDSDAFPELLITGLENDTIVLDDSNHSYVLLHQFDDGGEDALATGDVDGDGLDEIIGFRTKVVVYDDVLHDFVELFHSNTTAYNPNPNRAPKNNVDGDDRRLATGDVDGDGLDEIALIIKETVSSSSDPNIIYAILDDWAHNFTEIFRREKHDDLVDKNPVDVTLGDFDGDGRDELATLSEKKLRIYDYNPIQKKFSWIDTQQVISVDDYTITRARIISGYLGAADLFESIVLAFTTVPSIGMGLSFIKIYEVRNDVITSKYRGGLPSLINPDGSEFPASSIDARLANVDLDLDLELVVTRTIVQDTRYPDLVLGDSIEVYDDLNHDLEVIVNVANWNPIVGEKASVIAVGDLNGDSITGQFLDHDVTATDPYIFVVMAAPPTIFGTNQNLGASTTSYSIADTQEQSYTSGYTVTAGTVVSYELGFSLGSIGGGVEMSAAFSTEIERSVTTTTSITTSREYSTDYLDDYVIFETVLYDNYYYRVALHPNKSQIGKTFVVSIPRPPDIYKWTVTYFNDHNGNATDIGPEIFNHTVGQAWTYPTPEERDALLAKYARNGAWRSDRKMTVGQGGGSNSVGISLLTEETTSDTLSMSVEFTAGYKIGGFSQKFTVGYGSSVAYEIKIGKNTAFQGTVGDIGSKELYDSYRYSFGLFIYNYREVQDGKTVRAFQVINYWVEDYHGPKVNPTSIPDSETTANDNNLLNPDLQAVVTSNINIFNIIELPVVPTMGGVAALAILATTFFIFRRRRK